ncbi:MAG: UMP kinase [Spirochaetales bacterium]
MVKVISLGGSIVVPDSIHIEYLKKLANLVRSYLHEHPDRKLVFIVGGGRPAREYQDAYRAIVHSPDDESQDWIGIAATRLNGELLRGIFREECPNSLVTDPTSIQSFEGSILVAAGWKPGFSSDYDAVLLAEAFRSDMVINLSNIDQVYTADPRKDPSARPIPQLTWQEFRSLVGEDWVPGIHAPFDPIAARKAQELRLKVIVASGTDLDNLKNLLEDRPFKGTTIGPD